jgi:hypothetical protein
MNHQEAIAKMQNVNTELTEIISFMEKIKDANGIFLMLAIKQKYAEMLFPRVRAFLKSTGAPPQDDDVSMAAEEIKPGTDYPKEVANADTTGTN